jgi:hypothetical protein
MPPGASSARSPRGGRGNFFFWCFFDTYLLYANPSHFNSFKLNASKHTAPMMPRAPWRTIGSRSASSPTSRSRSRSRSRSKNRSRSRKRKRKRSPSRPRISRTGARGIRPIPGSLQNYARTPPRTRAMGSRRHGGSRRSRRSGSPRRTVARSPRSRSRGASLCRGTTRTRATRATATAGSATCSSRSSGRARRRVGSKVGVFLKIGFEFLYCD